VKVLIVEEALKNLHGHWYQYIRDIVEGGREAGHEIEVAVHKDACPEILKGLPCRPILSSTIFETKETGLGRVLRHNRSLYRDLSKFFSAGNSYDVVIAPTVRLDHLLAYFWLSLRYQGRGFKKLALIMINSIAQYSPDYSQVYFSKKRLPLKLALMLIRGLMKIRSIHFLAETAENARQFGRFSGIKYTVVPHVTVLPDLEPYRAKQKKAPHDLPVLGLFGWIRYDKGADIVQKAIKILLQGNASPQMKFVLQWTEDYQLTDGSWARKDPELEQSPAVQYLSKFKHSEEYPEWLVRTDIMVLPYRRAFYYDTLSRVAIDAAIAGMPMVYPAGTWLEGFVQRHGAGVAFEPENPASLAKAMQASIEKFQELKESADKRKKTAAEAVSARAFFEVIARLPKDAGVLSDV
jgi:glycosyltransferase involved in cell wall biosynthesis